MNNFARLLSIVFLFVFSHQVFSQAIEGEAEVQLRLVEPKTVFRIGEPIRFVLSFTASGDGFTLDKMTSKIGSDLDTVVLSPNASVFEWANIYHRAGKMPECVIMSEKLGAAPSSVELTLNDFVRFDRPGKYSLRVETKRVSANNRRAESWSPLTLTTNEVRFEIQEMSPAAEAEAVKRLSAALDAKRSWQEEARSAEELSYLTGDVATREKVRRFLDPQERSGNYFAHILYGLFIARNRALAIELLETALRDANRPVNFQLLGTLARLRKFDEDAQTPADAAVKIGFFQPDARFEEIRASYLKELLETLPARTGKNRLTTAVTILDSLQRENPPSAVAKQVREILLAEFNNLHVYEQERLLGAYWDLLRDKSLTTSLEKTLANVAVPFYTTRSVALERLIELDPVKARPFVIAEISKPQSVVDVETLTSLTDEFLPEADDALLRQITTLAESNSNNRNSSLLRVKARFAARFATARIYDGLLRLYQAHANQLSADAKASLLGYFVKHNDAEAVRLAENALASLGENSQFSFLTDLTSVNYSPGINDLLLRRLNSDDLEAASTAAYLMAKHGTAENRQFIETRLGRYWQTWRGRAAELNQPNPSGKIMQAAMFQVNAIDALRSASAWKLSDAESARLKDDCLSERCREYFRVREKQP